MTATRPIRGPPGTGPPNEMCCVPDDVKRYSMAWVRVGDTSAMQPELLSVLEHPEFDDRLLNEVWGFVVRCAAQSGQHKTDYVVSRGTATLIAGPTRVDVCVSVAVWADLMSEIEVDGRSVYKIKDDDHEFIHLRLKAEIEWENQRKLDNARPQLIVPVRLRDGDACRWCGCIVDWFDRRSGRAGTYDHLQPAEPATVDTYVVCCRSCNSSRGNGDAPKGRTEVLPPPDRPYFSEKTVEWLTENRWRQSQKLEVPAPALTRLQPGEPADGTQPPAPRPSNPGSRTRVAHSAPSDDRSSVSDHAPADPDPTQTRVAPSAPSAPAEPDGQTRVAPSAPSGPPPEPPPPSDPDPADNCRTQLDSADRRGTGPVESGRAGSGRVGSPDQPTPSKSPSRRSRGGRRRGSPSPAER
ncbi:hypothetical protein SEA_EWALD_49 [Gordonia phage Ewald]|nr:hypothetical protein SEA_EWALD_49 [Gordonia phage Ewald]